MSLKRSFGSHLVSIWILLLLFSLPLVAQVRSRTDEWQKARADKAKRLEPEELSKTEARLNYVRDHRLLERFAQGVAGFRIRLGGLATGQGFAIGPEYLRREILEGQVRFRGSARGASGGGFLMDLQLTLPRLMGEKAFVDLSAIHQNYPRVDYFGPGPESEKGNRTNFRLETTTSNLTAGLRPLAPLRFGVNGGFLQTNTGPGTRSDVPSTEEIFTPTSTAGLERQADFLMGGFFAHLDYRDNPGGPRAGGSYLARFSAFDDRSFGQHDFRRLELEAQQYLPFFNRRRVVALRVRSVMTFMAAGQSVPFYLQPTLGGSDDMRGFRAYRFYDDHQIVLNGEYRWESFSGLDAAVFVDAGKVVPRRSQLDLKDLETTVGFGLRFNVRNNVFMRVDVGFSHEGTHLWLKFKNPF